MLVMISKAEAGLNLGLTIDARITRIMEREMNIAESTYNPDGMIAIAMNPKNGEILGMSSRPSFDPADFQSVSPKCITEIYLYGVRMSLVQHLRSLH